MEKLKGIYTINYKNQTTEHSEQIKKYQLIDQIAELKRKYRAKSANIHYLNGSVEINISLNLSGSLCKIKGIYTPC